MGGVNSVNFKRPCGRHNRTARPRGFMLLMGMLSLTALVGFTGLAVDFGHIQTAKMALRCGCDAAARAASRCLGISGVTAALQLVNAQAAAIQIASQNSVDDQPIILSTVDVLVGNYDTTQSPAFLAGRSPYNAVQVTAYRDHTHNNPILLALASMVGVTSCDINETAVATKAPQPSTYGIAGVNSVTFGSLGVAATVQGNLVSNGTLSVGMPLGVGVSVTGDARSYSGSVSKGSLANISGSTSALDTSLYYPSVSLPTTYDDSAIAANLDSSKNFTAVGIADIQAGTYVVHDLNFLAGLIVNLHGPTTIYVTGSFNMAATINLLNVLNTTPNMLNVMMAPGSHVNFLASLVSPVCMNLYGPDTDITIAVSVNHYSGCLIGKTLDICLPVLGTFTEGPPPASTTPSVLVQ